MRVAREIKLTDALREALEKAARARTASVRFALRAKMILMAADGMTDLLIAEQLNVSRQSVARWRGRFLLQGIEGIQKDAPRPGRKPKISAQKVQKVVRMTTLEKPSDATHWSTRTMARASGLSEASVRRIWKRHGLKPHLLRTFKLSNDPLFSEKVEDIVGLYLNPPEHALVLCADEKSQVQALERTQPVLPLGLGYLEGVTHDYYRHGTTTLFAALNVLDGSVITQCKPRHRHQEFLAFLKHLDRNVPADLEVHLIADNYATHKHPRVKAWLARHPRYHIHYTPTYASWLNQVERWFALITQQAIRRGSFRSVRQLVQKIDQYVAHHNLHKRPFAWTATADSILDKLQRLCKLINGTLH